MFSGVKLFPRRSRPSADQSDQTTDSEIFYQATVHPRQEGFYGRYLAFCVESSTIQMAAAQHRGRRCKLLDVRTVALGGSGDEVDPATAADTAISEFLAEYGRKTARVVVSISGGETTFRTFLMPQLKRRDLAAAIRFEARKQVPFPLHDCIIGYRPVNRVTKGDDSRYRIALFAATNRTIEEAMGPFRRLDRGVDRVFLGLDAVGQLLKRLPDFHDDKGYVIVDIGHVNSEIGFFRGMNLEFLHLVNTGTSMMGQDSTGVGLEYLAETLTTSIQTSVDYYSGLQRVPSVTRMFLSGNMASNPELIRLLNDSLSFEFAPFPVRELDFLADRDGKDADELISSLRAVAGATCTVQVVNLLPAADRERQRRRRLETIGRASLVTLLVLFTAGWGAMNQNLNSLQAAADMLSRDVDRFESSEAYHRYHVLKGQIATENAYISRAKATPSFLGLNLKELSLLTPSRIRLTMIEFKAAAGKENLAIRGVVRSWDVPPEVILAEYVAGLSASPFYEQVKVTRHNKRQLDKAFEIEFQLGMKGII